MRIRTTGSGYRLSALPGLMVGLATRSGCASIQRLSHFPEDPEVYGGIRIHIKRFPLGQFTDFHRTGGPGSGGNMGDAIVFVWTFWWFPVDLTLSFAIDTAALPVTLWTLFEGDFSEDGEDDPSG